MGIEYHTLGVSSWSKFRAETVTVVFFATVADLFLSYFLCFFFAYFGLCVRIGCLGTHVALSFLGHSCLTGLVRSLYGGRSAPPSSHPTVLPGISFFNYINFIASVCLSAGAAYAPLLPFVCLILAPPQAALTSRLPR